MKKWGEFEWRSDKEAIHKLLERLGDARLVALDIGLMSAVENARYTWPVYADAHWIHQVIAVYRSSAGQKEMNTTNITAAACERVMRTAVLSGPHKAKEEAAIIGPMFGVPSWVAFPDDRTDYARWLAVRMERQREIRNARDGD